MSRARVRPHPPSLAPASVSFPCCRADGAGVRAAAGSLSLTTCVSVCVGGDLSPPPPPPPPSLLTGLQKKYIEIRKKIYQIRIKQTKSKHAGGDHGAGIYLRDPGGPQLADDLLLHHQDGKLQEHGNSAGGGKVPPQVTPRSLPYIPPPPRGSYPPFKCPSLVTGRQGAEG